MKSKVNVKTKYDCPYYISRGGHCKRIALVLVKLYIDLGVSALKILVNVPSFHGKRDRQY